MPFIATNLDETVSVFTKSRCFYPRMILWKGDHLAMAIFKNGQKRKIRISNYGGFFTDMTIDVPYIFEGDSRLQWDEFLSENKIVVSTQ